MEKIVFTAKFDGGYAKEHKVPAYKAVQALMGLSRSIIIPSHYLLEGRVRHRSIESDKYNLFLKPPRKGSFEALMEFGYVAGAVLATNPVAVNVTSNLITETIMSAIKMTTGKKLTAAEKQTTESSIPPGDLAAIAAAIEPGLRSAHGIVNEGVVNINFISTAGGNVTLDQSTKNYINTIRKENAPQIGLLSVSKWDALNKTGSAFDPELGRVVPFSVDKKIDRSSVAAVLRSNANYSLGLFDRDEDSSYIAMKFDRVVDIDGSVKRIEVSKARNTIEEL